MSNVQRGGMGVSPYRQHARNERPPTPEEEWQLLMNRAWPRSAARTAFLLFFGYLLLSSLARAVLTVTSGALHAVPPVVLVVRMCLPFLYAAAIIGELVRRRRYARSLEAAGVAVPDHLRP